VVSSFRQEVQKLPSVAAEVDTGYAATPSPKSSGKARLLTLGDLDRRTTASRRAAALIESFEQDLLNDGDRLGEGKRQLIQRAAVLGTFIESCEAQWLSGGSVELADYLAAINSQRRVLATLGLDRRSRKPLRSLLGQIVDADAQHSAGEDDES
jgi:hypothetical protein